MTAKKKMSKEERAELKAFLEQMEKNAERTLQLAEKAQAELDRRKGAREQ